MADYDLTGALKTKFTFSIGEYEFEFRKPTVREMREVAKKFQGIDENADTNTQIEKSDEAMQELYNFIIPVGHEKNVADLISDQPVGVQVAFNEMIKKELGASS